MKYHRFASNHTRNGVIASRHLAAWHSRWLPACRQDGSPRRYVARDDADEPTSRDHAPVPGRCRSAFGFVRCRGRQTHSLVEFQNRHLNVDLWHPQDGVGAEDVPDPIAADALEHRPADLVLGENDVTL